MALTQISTFSDLQLVECVGLREADGLNEIYRRHSRSVGSAARMVLGNSSACDDVVAEVFLALWLKPDSFDATRGSLLGFLRMKARGRSIDIVRSDVARRRRELTDGRANDRYPSQPDNNILTLGNVEQLRDALGALIEREREPIELAFFGGLTYKEVAGRLNLPEGTIKSRIRSGLQNARIFYESEFLTDAMPELEGSLPVI